MKPRYKTASLQNMYETVLALAADPASELYFNRLPHRGAGHRTAFWDGYAGLTKTANVVPGTMSAACFAAGKTFAKTNPGIRVEDAVWTPGVTRQGGSDVAPVKPETKRQRLWRARNASEDLKEVRGIIAHVDDHLAVKAAAAKIAKLRERRARLAVTP